ncbi:MAG: hypothetical protein RL595_614 [Planctomycetota bacterium]|jgi:pimeloyl-ACP methyl ester carboxylesterase
MELIYLGLLLLFVPLIAMTIGLSVAYYLIQKKYLQFVGRIFQEKPLFVIPRGEPNPDAEEVRFTTSDGLTLQGCYLKTEKPRKGVILFGLEFGSNRWSCSSYCDWLLASGYDIFTYESRSQGDSDRQPNYEPLQWITQYEVDDCKAAIAYLKSRPDKDSKGIGLFAMSKGAAAGLFIASEDPFIRCICSDGVFASMTTMVPYMRQWISIYSDKVSLHPLIPSWFFQIIGYNAIRLSEQERSGGCHFKHLEPRLARLRQPWFMIHGALDGYIWPDMARNLFNLAKGPKLLWIVPGAKHNGGIHVAGDEYRTRVLQFFNHQLAGMEPAHNFPKIAVSSLATAR